MNILHFLKRYFLGLFVTATFVGTLIGTLLLFGEFIYLGLGFLLLTPGFYFLGRGILDEDIGDEE